MLLDHGWYVITGNSIGIFAGAAARPSGRAISVLAESLPIVSFTASRTTVVQPSAATIPLFVSSKSRFVLPTDQVITTKGA